MKNPYGKDRLNKGLSFRFITSLAVVLSFSKIVAHSLCEYSLGRFPLCSFSIPG
jgi:hypothetical protein